MGPINRNRSRGRSRARSGPSGNRRGRSRSPFVRALQDNFLQPALSYAMGPVGAVGMGLASRANAVLDSGNGYRSRSRSTNAMNISRNGRFRSRSVSRGGGRGRNKTRSGARRRSSARPRVNNRLEKVFTTGVVSTEEVHGTVDDPDCVYIMAQSVDVFRIFRYISVALVRKLFQKAGHVITNTAAQLPNRTMIDGAGWRVQLWGDTYDLGTQNIFSTTDSVAGSTIETMSYGIERQLIGHSAGNNVVASAGAPPTPGTGNANNLHEPNRLILYETDGTVYSYVCELNLHDEVCHWNASAKLKVQNRSAAANGLTEADEVSNNPIQGFKYYFPRQPVMRINGDQAIPGQNQVFNYMSVDKGVQLIQAADVSSSLKEPPYKSAFSNCSSRIPMYLAPGAIIQDVVKSSGKMKLLPFVRKIALQYGAGPDYYCHKNIFPTIMFAFEDVINQNVNRLTCAYEVDRKVGISFNTSKKTGVLGLNKQTEYDNVTV